MTWCSSGGSEEGASVEVGRSPGQPLIRDLRWPACQVLDRVALPRRVRGTDPDVHRVGVHEGLPFGHSLPWSKVNEVQVNGGARSPTRGLVAAVVGVYKGLCKRDPPAGVLSPQGLYARRNPNHDDDPRTHDDNHSQW